VLDTYGAIWNRILLRCPAASSFLARDWTQNAFRQIAERRRWSWLLRFGQFIAPPLYNTGRVNCTNFSTTITGVGTNWDQSMVGRQFRVGLASPMYTVNTVTSATELDLDAVWGPPTATNVPYEIYQCFFTPPNDFHALVTVWDPAMNWQLWRHIQQIELNTWDAQRSSRGQAYVVAHRDYSRGYVGKIQQPVKAAGCGATPSATSPVAITPFGYTGPADAIFSVQTVVGGQTGTATYQWKKNTGPWTTGITTSIDPQDLQDGVQIYWPTGVDYLANSVYVIVCTAGSNPGLPRYEIWPHQTAAYVYPYLYEARAQDISDVGTVLPRYIRGDVLLEMALAEAARWPGPSADKPNPYFNLKLSDIHTARAERMIMELERQDDETYELDIQFQMPLGFPYATPLGDSSWLQAHAI